MDNDRDAQLNVRVTQPGKLWLTETAKEHDISVSALVRICLALAAENPGELLKKINASKASF